MWNLLRCTASYYQIKECTHNGQSLGAWYGHIFRHNLQAMACIVGLKLSLKVRHDADKQRPEQLHSPAQQTATVQLLGHLLRNQIVKGLSDTPAGSNLSGLTASLSTLSARRKTNPNHGATRARPAQNWFDMPTVLCLITDNSQMKCDERRGRVWVRKGAIRSPAPWLQCLAKIPDYLSSVSDRYFPASLLTTGQCALIVCANPINETPTKVDAEWTENAFASDTAGHANLCGAAKDSLTVTAERSIIINASIASSSIPLFFLLLNVKFPNVLGFFKQCFGSA